MFSLSALAHDEMTVLKRIHSLGKVTPDGLAMELGEPYTAQGLTAYLRQLEEKALVKKTMENPATYELSPLGSIAIGALPESAKKAYATVAPDKCFHFYTGTGPDKYTHLSACSLADFSDKAKKVDAKSLEFHVQRGDVAKWLKDVLGEAELSREFDRLKSVVLSGEVLRSRVVRLLDNRIQSLSSSTSRIRP
jgi:hypothetical protein